MKKKNLKKGLEHVLAAAEKATERYMSAENILMMIADMPWWKRLFVNKLIWKYFHKLGIGVFVNDK